MINDSLIWGLVLLFFFGSGFVLFALLLIYALVDRLLKFIEKMFFASSNVMLAQYQTYVNAVNVFIAETCRAYLGVGKRPPPFPSDDDDEGEVDPDVDPDFDFGGGSKE